VTGMATRKKKIAALPEDSPGAPPPPERKTFEDRLLDIARATAMAGEVAKSAGEDPTGLNEAALRLAQEKLFTILVEADPGQDPWETLPKITRAVADLSRTAFIQMKMKDEIKKKLAAKVDSIEQGAKGGPKLKEALEQVRKVIYGL